MRKIKRTNQFKRDYKREKKSVHNKNNRLDHDLLAAIKYLIEDKPLPAKQHDHALTGNWCDHRDCHIRPDLILIYRKPNTDVLELIRLGSHSELSL